LCAADLRSVVHSECVVGSPASVGQFSGANLKISISLLSEEWAIKEA